VALTVHLLVWLGVGLELACCVGLVAARTAIDRLHFAGAATVAGPPLVAAAVCFEEGLFTTNGLNAVAVALLLALLGGALAVATARAIRLRDRGTLESSPAERERGQRTS
jgi:multisubunit Na+/H+ antiporter MnhG subunit